MRLPDILHDDQIEDAAGLLSRYYAPLPATGLPRTGSRFENWAGGGDAPEVVNEVTADDLVAVSFLSVKIPGSAAVGVLETYQDEVSDLLSRIPADLDLSVLEPTDFGKVLGPGSPASELWDLLRGKRGGSWGIGQTKASKIMARKRPQLIPIYDSVIRPLMGLKNSALQWEVWHSALTDGTGLPQRLDVILKESGIDARPSRLRVMDIVLWMHGQK